MQIKDAPYHTLLVMTEKMENSIRQMLYIRRETDAPCLSNFVPAYGVATLIGESLWPP